MDDDVREAVAVLREGVRTVGEDAALMIVEDELAELDAARARLAALETELTKVKGYQRELAERCARKDLELDEWRTGGPGADLPLR